jgi:alkylation response protein AidB-like acyl-CoA dehydrogenase
MHMPSGSELAIQTARSLGTSVVAAEAAAVDRERRFPRRSIQSLAEAGLWGLTVPQQFGGSGCGAWHYVRVVEEIAQACGSTAMVYVMHICGAMPIVAFGSDEQRSQLLPPIAAGKTLATLAFSEPGSGAHFYAPVSRATTNGGGFLLTTDKSFVTSAGEADLYLVSTQSPAAASPLEIDLFMVRRDATGVSVKGRWEGLGLNGNASAPMRFEGVAAAAADRLGAEKSGLTTMMQACVPWFHLGVAAVNVGVARAALDASISHAKARKYEHSGQRLADLPGIQAILAEMSETLDAARGYLHQTARAVDEQSPDVLLALLQVKPVASEAALAVTAKAMRVCGGAAFAKHLPVERFFRDAQAGAIMAPTNDVLKEFIAKVLLGIPLF